LGRKSPRVSVNRRGNGAAAGFLSLSSRHRAAFLLEPYLMSKLIAAYQFNPTDANRAKLQAYIRKHMMSLCCATPEEITFLKANNFHYL
jgi:hypothetical protein